MVEIVTCGYDTSFAPVEDQVFEKLAQLDQALSGRPWRLRVVNDAPAAAELGPGVLRGFARAQRELGLDDEKMHLQPLFYGRPGRYGLKGLALREGLLSALDAGAERIVYVNLNPKVDAKHLAPGLRLMERGGWNAAVGSRAAAFGGRAEGAGVLGRTKSAVWSHLVRAALPPLSGWVDQNAPMKIFDRAAARAVTERARIDGVTLDAEWLLILAAGGLKVGRFPIVWKQRKGSRPPFFAIAPMVSDLRRIRRAWQRGHLEVRPNTGRG